MTYSAPEYEKTFYEYLPTVSGGIKTLSFQEPLEGFTLESKIRQGFTGTVHYYVRTGRYEWIQVMPGREYKISELAEGTLTTDMLSVKAGVERRRIRTGIFPSDRKYRRAGEL